MTELEMIWERFSDTDDFAYSQATEESEAALKAARDSIYSCIKQEDAHRFAVEHDPEIIEYGNVREKEGFIAGYKMAMRLAAEVFLNGGRVDE